jgi:hypothetical protein
MECSVARSSAFFRRRYLTRFRCVCDIRSTSPPLAVIPLCSQRIGFQGRRYAGVLSDVLTTSHEIRAVHRSGRCGVGCVYCTESIARRHVKFFQVIVFYIFYSAREDANAAARYGDASASIAYACDEPALHASLSGWRSSPVYARCGSPICTAGMQTMQPCAKAGAFGEIDFAGLA